MIEFLSKFMPLSIIRSIVQRPGFRKIIANAGWLFVDNVVSIIAGFLVGTWVARYLEPARYGTLNYALAFTALFAPLVALGLKDIVVRDIIRTPEDKGEILGTTFGLQLIGGLLALVLAISIALIVKPGDLLALWIIVILASQFIFQAFSITLVYWFNSQVQARYIVWANNIAYILYTLVRIGLILSKAPLISFAWASLGQVFIYAVAVAAFYRISGQTFFAWQISFSRARRLIGNSWPLLVSSLAIMVYTKIGQVMLGNMVDAKELGIYSAAIRLSELWYFIPMAISSSVFPALVRSRDNDGDEVFFDVMAGSAYLIVIPLVLLATFLVKFLFGPDYIGADSMLRIHAWAILIGSLGVTRSRWLVAEDMIPFYMLTTVLGALTNVAMNFFLIPEYGGLGAAWAVVISQAVSTYLSSVLSKKLWPVFYQQSLSLLVPFRFVSVAKSLVEMLEKPQSS
jgi:PST family polysaccharide transporter